MKQFILFLLVGFLLISCKEDAILKKAINSSKDKSNKIVLIFKKPPQNWKYVWADSSGAYSHFGKYELSYVNTALIQQNYKLDYESAMDTLTIKTIEPVELLHKYKGVDKFSYLFRPGDTAFFSYNGIMPVVEIKNKKTKKFDFSYDSLKRAVINNHDFSSVLKYVFPSSLFIKQNENLINRIEWKKMQRKLAEEEFIKENRLLDSIFKHKFISKKQHNFYSNRTFFLDKKIALEENELDKKEVKQLLGAKNEDLLKYAFYRGFVEKMVRDNFIENVHLIKSSHGSIYDYRTVYDSIAQSSLFPSKTKKYLLRVYLEKIINNFSIEDTDEYFGKFNKRYQDNFLKNYLVKKYKLKDTVSDQMNLLNATKKTSTFAEFLKKNTGKVIYVDYWASWCKPCRAAMPASHELRKKLEDENVVFLYLAFNDRYDPWIKATEQIGLAGYEHSFLINNTKYSQLIIDLDIPTIPRYMIYDKKGQLVHKNAPGPTSEEIAELLKMYVAE